MTQNRVALTTPQLWQSVVMNVSTGGPRRGRVIESHRLLAIALQTSAAFTVGAIAWAVVTAVNGGSWWGPIHMFLAGAVLAAITGASQMFTITWATTAPPPRWVTITQGMLLVVGVLLVLVGVPLRNDVAVWVGGIFVAAALGLLAVAIAQIVRQSLLRRFDLSSRFYILAMATGVIGVTLGTLVATSAFPSQHWTLRTIHMHLNLVGLVGFTIIGTLPTILATFAKHRVVSGREVRIALWLCVGMVAVTLGALVGPIWLVGIGNLLAATAAVLVTSGIVYRFTAMGKRPGLSFWAVVSGVFWLTAWALADALGLMSGTPSPPFSRWTVAAIVFGVGQVLAGSVAYLVPVLFGVPLRPNLDRMTRHPVVPLVAANLAAVALVMGFASVASVACAVWLADFGRRLISLRRETPEHMAV